MPGMKSIRAIFENGQVRLLEPVDVAGPVEGVLVLPDPDPWDELIRDPSPRPGLAKEADEVLQRHHGGQSKPLDPAAL